MDDTSAAGVRTVDVDVPDILPRRLKKDLQEGQDLCPVCGGVGLVPDKLSFGIRDKVVGFTRSFPYSLESLKPCSNCYNGVVRICRYCGKPAPRKWAAAEAGCECPGARTQRSESARAKRIQKWENARKIPLSEALQTFQSFYIGDYDMYVDAEEFEAWLDAEVVLPEFIYGTREVALTLDAGNILENAADNQNLHDDVIEDISDARFEELQKLLDEWCASVREATGIYIPDYSVGVILDATSGDAAGKAGTEG